MCPYYKNKQVFNEFNEIVLAFDGKPMTEDEFKSRDLRNLRSGQDLIAMEIAYQLWDKNNGYALDKAPNGKDSNLFNTLLKLTNNNRKFSIILKSRVYSSEFADWFGDWLSVNDLSSNTNTINTDLVDVEQHNKPWKNDKSRSNETLRVYLKDHSKGYFELVKDEEFGMYSVHFKTNKPGAKYNGEYTPSTKLDRKILFKELVKLIPDGAQVSTWGDVSPDGVVGLNNVGRNMTKVGERKVLSKDKDENGNNLPLTIPIYQKGEGVSKIVDENGEPLIVYHGSPYSFDAFTLKNPGRHYVDANSSLLMLEQVLEQNPDIDVSDESVEDFESDISKYDGYYFTKDLGYSKAYSENKNNIYPVYLNARNVLDLNNDSVVNKSNKTFGDNVNHQTVVLEKLIHGDTYDGMIGDEEYSTSYVVFDSNQVKSVANEGKFDKNKTSIYAQKVPTATFSFLQKCKEREVLGSTLSKKLNNGETVSSKNIVSYMLNSDIFGTNTELANILSKHDVPVMYGETELDLLAVTVTNDGGSYIVINKSSLNKVSRLYFATTILHEIIHALTVNAINNPKTAEEIELAKVNSDVFNRLNKLFSSSVYNRNDFYQGFYALSNEKEFAAIYMTDHNVRDAFYQEAKKSDEKFFNKVINSVKKLINAFTKFLVNKQLFNGSSVEMLQKYDKVINDYIYNKTPLINGSLTKEQLKSIYASVDDEIVYAEKTDMIARALKYEIPSADINAQHEEARKITSFEDISKKLSTRLLSIKNSSLDPDVRSQETESTKTAIELLNSANVAKLVAIQNILISAGSYIHQRQREIRNKSAMSAKDIRFALHSDFALYEQIFDDFNKFLKNIDDRLKLIAEYNRIKSQSDPDMTNDTVNELVSSITNISQTCKDCREWMEQLRRNSTIGAMALVGDYVNSPTIHSYLENMFNPKKQRPVDMLALEHSFGAADAVEDESIRLMAHMVKRAKDIANDKTIDKAVDILELLKKLDHKNDIRFLYELDDKKRRTGYLTRKRNYGKFYKDYDNFLILLNREVSKKYNIPIADDNRIAPDNKEAKVTWQKGKNEWLSLHCDRLYTKEYYDAWSEVSHETRMAMRDINNLIFSMTNRVTDPNTGLANYMKFTEEEWNKLQSLFEQKRLLRSWYDINGQRKKEGTPEYEIAKELNQLYEKLYKGQQLSKNVSAWNEARDNKIAECGGKEEYNKWIKGEESTFDGKTFEKWEDRNTRWEFVKNDEDVAVVFAKIEEEMQGRKPYYGAEYDAISKQINEMLSPFYRPNGEINSDAISETLKNEIKKLLKKQSLIRKSVVKTNPNLSEMSKQYGVVFNKYLEFVDTEQFKAIKSSLRNLYYDMPEVYDMVIAAYGTAHFNVNLGIYDSFRPYRWYQRLQAKDRLAYMEPRPGDAWIDKSNNVTYKNKDFDESEGTVFVPKMKIDIQDTNGVLYSELGIKLDQSDIKRYDNSDRYNRIVNNKALNDYYEEIKKTIVESNALLTNRPSVDNYLLPQVVGSLWQQLRNHPWISAKEDSAWSVLWRYITEMFGKINENDEQEMFGLNTDLSDTDDTGATIDYKYDPFKDTYAQSMPDGSAYRALPLFYTRKLKDPSRLSSDLSGIVIGYYNMSYQYHEKSKIADQCELISEELKNAELRAGNIRRKVESVIGGKHGESNTYRMAREWLDANLYDIRKIQQEHGKMNLTKFASNFSMWTTSTNLGLNPKVAIVGAMTTGWTHLINALTGLKYDISVANKAGFTTLYHIGKNVFGVNLINDSLSNDKQMLLMEMCNVSNQLTKKYENTQRNRIIQAINKNWLFGMMSTCDYIMKALIMTSVFMSYRFVDGEFITKDDIRMNAYKGGTNRLSYVKNRMKAWNNSVSLYDVLYSKNHRIECQDLYKQAFEKIRHIVINRALKYTEHADGMATQEQKALITRGIIGSFILIHRQYLPLMIQERVGHTVYDYDTQQMKNGQFRRLFKFISALLLSNKYASAAAGVGVASALSLGFLGAAGAGIGMYMYSRSQQNKKGSTSMKLVINSYFNDYSSREANIETLMNKYAFKQIAYELALFHLVVNTVANMICFYADDHDDDKLIQALAYWMRGFQWEAFTPYRLNDIFQNFKSPSAALSMVDRISTFFNMANTSLVEDPIIWFMSLCGSTIFDQDYNSKIKRGTYKHKSKVFRDTMKATPLKNTYEQIVDSRAKRNYAENQLYMIDKKEQKNSLLYKAYSQMFK